MLLFHENKPNDNKGISKHWRCCWQQLFGPLRNITISLKLIMPNKTEIKIIAMISVSTWARIFSLHHPVITAPTPYPLTVEKLWSGSNWRTFLVQHNVTVYHTMLPGVAKLSNLRCSTMCDNVCWTMLKGYVKLTYICWTTNQIYIVIIFSPFFSGKDSSLGTERFKTRAEHFPI